MKKIDTWLQSLQENGYRLTKPRIAVLQTITRSKRVLNPFEIFELAKKDYPRLGLVTVYRTIEKLVELELVQRVHQPSGCQAYIAAFSGHQHLLICNSCGRVEFFSGDQEKISALIEQVASDSNYYIDSHWLQFFGTCQACQDAH
jgi:Fur family ferric uptake transcriptional regulator